MSFELFQKSFALFYDVMTHFFSLEFMTLSILTFAMIFFALTVVSLFLAFGLWVIHYFLKAFTPFSLKSIIGKR